MATKGRARLGEHGAVRRAAASQGGGRCTRRAQGKKGSPARSVGVRSAESARCGARGRRQGDRCRSSAGRVERIVREVEVSDRSPSHDAHRVYPTSSPTEARMCLRESRMGGARRQVHDRVDIARSQRRESNPSTVSDHDPEHVAMYALHRGRVQNTQPRAIELLEPRGDQLAEQRPDRTTLRVRGARNAPALKTPRLRFDRQSLGDERRT